MCKALLVTREAGQLLARDLPRDLLEQMIQVQPLEKVCELGEKILAGQIRGRTVIDVNHGG
jgi:acrylyl-CoA reductase (NADPH)